MIRQTKLLAKGLTPLGKEAMPSGPESVALTLKGTREGHLYTYMRYVSSCHFLVFNKTVQADITIARAIIIIASHVGFRYDYV